MQEKIIFAFQFWNKEFEWYTPNGHPEDWVVDGKKELPFSHGEYYFNIPDSNLTDFSYESIIKSNFKAKKSEHLFFKKNIEFKLLDDIPKNQKYLFPIFIHKIEYFYAQDIISLKYISQRVIDDVKNNIAKIVFYFPFEGNVSITNGEFGEYRNFGSMILNLWCKNFGFEKDQIYFINANLLSNEFNSKTTNCTLIGIDTFIDWVPENFINEPLIEFKYKNNKFLFLSYNRNVRTHRKLFLLKLLSENLFEKGIISCGSAFNPYITKIILEKFDAVYLEPYISKINELIPLFLDLDLNKNNPAIQITKEHYESTFISIVTETHFEKDILFRSEKIFKTIAIGHPFIVLSSQYFLRELKKLGFKTFDKWIDESYDNEPDIMKRIEMITDELKKLSSKSIEELDSIRNEMKLILSYNKQLFKIYYYLNNNLNSFVDKELKKIWNTLKV